MPLAGSLSESDNVDAGLAGRFMDKVTGLNMAGECCRRSGITTRFTDEYGDEGLKYRLKWRKTLARKIGA